ncbi:MAG: LamG-like jellyroll fold domain-containing protein [Verrucomicrobiota bacterium]
MASVSTYADVLPAIADNILLQNGTPSGADTSDAEDNFGGRTEVIMGNNGANPRHAIFRFDVSSLEAAILANADLNTAVFRIGERIGRDGNNGDSSTDFTIYPLVAGNAGWVEGTKTGSSGGYSAEAGSSSYMFLAAPSAFDQTDGTLWFSQGGGSNTASTLPTPSVLEFGTDTGAALGTGTFAAVSGNLDELVINLDLAATKALLPQWLADGTNNAGLIIESTGTAQRFFQSIEGAGGAGDGAAATLELVFDAIVGDDDFDGILDVNETNNGPDSYVSPTDTGTDPTKFDTDGDGISDGDEINTAVGTTVFTDPTKADTDDDGLPDLWEINNNLDPNDSTGDNGAAGDPDGDLLPNIEEFDPGSGTGSGSGLYDPTDPQVADADLDGLNDRQEIYGTENTFFPADTDPADSDTDDDGLTDGEETSGSENPFLSGVLDDGPPGDPTDPNNEFTDGDSLTDKEEIDNRLDPNDDSGDNGDGGDPDADNLDNFDEIRVVGTDPRNPDTDNDELNDDVEDAGATDPLNPDSDNDGVTDGDETQGEFNDVPHAFGATDPVSQDSDGDGRSDGFELSASPQTNPNDIASFPPVVPAAYWPLDESGTATVAPEWVNGNDAVAANPPLWTAGFFDNAADIQGDTAANQWFQAPTLDGLVGATSITVSAWINARPTNTGYRGILTTRGEGPTNNENWGLNIEGNNGNTDNRVPVNGSGASNGINNNGPEAGNVFFPNTWYHIVMTYNGATGDVKTYTNGVPGATGSATHPTTLNGEGWTIGIDINNAGRDFGGLIDDAAIFPIALSDAEILNIYTEGNDNGMTIGDIYGLTAPPAPGSFRVTSISHDPGADTVDLTWNSDGLAATFRIRASSDLTGPVSGWTEVASGIANAGATTSFQLTGQTDPSTYYVIEEE